MSKIRVHFSANGATYHLVTVYLEFSVTIYKLLRELYSHWGSSWCDRFASPARGFYTARNVGKAIS
jgi:hypothetical protein